MIDIETATLISGVSVVIALFSFIYSVLANSTSSFEKKAAKQNELIEILYMRILNIYTQKVSEKERLYKEFFDSTSLEEVNTTLLPSLHDSFIELKYDNSSLDSFNKIEPFFDNFAVIVERAYWKQHEYKLYTVLESGSLWKSIVRRVIWGCSKILNNIDVLAALLTFLMMGTLLLSGINIFISIFFSSELDFLTNLMVIFIISLFLSLVIFFVLAVIANFTEKYIDNTSVVIKGKTFIKRRVSSYQNY